MDTEIVNVGGRILGNVGVLGFFFGIFKFFMGRLDRRFQKMEDRMAKQVEDFEEDVDSINNTLKGKADISELKEFKKENKDDHKALFKKVDDLPFKIIELLKATKEG